MDNQRLLIWASFGLLMWLTYQAWVADYGPQSVTNAPTSTERPAMPGVDDQSLPALPSEAADSPQLLDDAPALDGIAPDTPEPSGEIIRVVTDVLRSVSARKAVRCSKRPFATTRSQKISRTFWFSYSVPDEQNWVSFKRG